MKSIKAISEFICDLKNNNEVYKFLFEIFTKAELEDLSKRWRILECLNEGMTQRAIAKELQVSLCKVTRGAKIMKNKNAIVSNYLRKDKK